MSEFVVMPKTDWQEILNSVRAKTGNTELMTSGVVAAEIEGIKTGSAVSSKDVNFYDYDGTRLYSYTVAEAQKLTELPELPTQQGLICQGWNWTLEDIKAHNRAVNVGAMYITDDGKTRLYIRIATEGRMTVPLYIQQTVANGVTIDWGDGSAAETIDGTGKVNTTHTYASIGDYIISLDVANGCTLKLGHNTSSYCVMGSTSNNGIVYCNMLKKVAIGNNTQAGQYAFVKCYSLVSVVISNNKSTIGDYAFYNCYGLASIVIPMSASSLPYNGFYNCYTLASISIPATVTSLGGYMCNGCYSLDSVVIPDKISSISGSAFYNCYALTTIVIPASVTSIGSNAFAGCYGMRYYDFTACTSVPTLESTYALYQIPSDCQIRVPASLYDEWIAATNWSTYASNIVAV